MSMVPPNRDPVFEKAQSHVRRGDEGHPFKLKPFSEGPVHPGDKFQDGRGGRAFHSHPHNTIICCPCKG